MIPLPAQLLIRYRGVVRQHCVLPVILISISQRTTNGSAGYIPQTDRQSMGWYTMSGTDRGMFGVRVYAASDINTFISRARLCRVLSSRPHFP
jgi:hypothetical protein